MGNLFLHYMHERVRREKDHVIPEPGPVITISREYGCYGKQVALQLVEKINSQITSTDTPPWIAISHQVLQDAATSLRATPKEISHIFGAQEKSIYGDLVSIFSKDKYYSNHQIKRAIAEIVRSYSIQGNAVIVGRAGCVLAKPIRKSIHIRLMAPTDWRVDVIKRRFDISETEAVDKVKETDKRRETFMEFYRGNKPDSELFDLILNRATLSTEEIADLIYAFAKLRELI